MTAVCVEAAVPGKKKTVKTYRAPTQEETDLANVELEVIEDAFGNVP
jgi:hypothetical protein